MSLKTFVGGSVADLFRLSHSPLRHVSLIPRTPVIIHSTTTSSITITIQTSSKSQATKTLHTTCSPQYTNYIKESSTPRTQDVEPAIRPISTEWQCGQLSERSTKGPCGHRTASASKFDDPISSSFGRAQLFQFL